MNFGSTRGLVLLLAVASLLRLVLVVQGGQLYWPDERLYTQVLDIFDLHRGHPFDIVKALVSTQDHLGFALISAIPAGVQFAIGHALSRTGNGLMILPGAVLSQASVLSIALVYAIARRAGRDTAEALLAAVLMAAATTQFYYARHLLPYDSSLALGLLALWCALGRTRRDSIACGAAASAAFITYNGYWLLVGMVLVMHVAQQGAAGREQGAGTWDLGSGIRRAILAGIGFLLVPGIPEMRPCTSGCRERPVRAIGLWRQIARAGRVGNIVERDGHAANTGRADTHGISAGSA